MGKYNNRDIMKDLDSFCKPVTENHIDYSGIMWLFNRYTRAHLKEGDEQIDIWWVYLMTERLIAGVRALANEKEELEEKYKRLEEIEKESAKEYTGMYEMYRKAWEYQMKELKQEKDRIERERDDQKGHIEELKTAETKARIENNRLKEQVEMLEKTLEEVRHMGTVNGHYMERARVKNGAKTAYKEEASEEKVYEYLVKGYSRKQIAETLNVHVGTIGRRIKALERQGITLPEKGKQRSR